MISPSSARPTRAPAGFTLLETLVVLTILGLALGMVAQYAPTRARPFDLRLAASEIAGTLRQGRARAVAGNRMVGVGFDTATRAMALDGAIRHFPAPLGFAVTTRAAMVAGSVATIVFAPDGSSSGGLVSITDGTREMRVAVDWLTGRVRQADGP